MARVRRNGQGGACPAEHAEEGCVGASAMARGSMRERRTSDRARVRGGARGEGVRGHGCAGGGSCLRRRGTDAPGDGASSAGLLGTWGEAGLPNTLGRVFGFLHRTS